MGSSTPPDGRYGQTSGGEFRVFLVIRHVAAAGFSGRGECSVHSRDMEWRNEWLSTEDVARELGMSPDWVRAQVAAGRLKARTWTTGRRSTIRIRRRDLDEFVSRHSSTSD